MKECRSCGAYADDNDTECRYCGNILHPTREAYTENTYAPNEPPRGYRSYAPPPPPNFHTHTPPPYPSPPVPPYPSYPPYYRRCNRVVAGILAIVLGGLGVHKFYMGKIGKGILYFLFAFTSIPSIIGLIEGIVYLTMDDYTFLEKYCRLY